MTTLEVKATLPFALRALAAAMDERATILRNEFAPCPGLIEFKSLMGAEVPSYQNNPALFERMKIQIAKQWDRLRADAIEANQAEIDHWAGEIATALMNGATAKPGDDE